MKTILLLLCSISLSFVVQAQTFMENLEGDALVLLSEKIVQYATQEGLVADNEWLLDSMKTMTYQPNDQNWQADSRKYYYYQDNQRQKEQLFRWQLEEQHWQPNSQNTFNYHSTGQLQTQITELWENNEWLPTTQIHQTYTNENQLVKTHLQHWMSDLTIWKDQEVGQIHYGNDGKKIALSTAQLMPETHTWEEKDFRHYIYKSENDWLDEEIYQIWKEDVQGWLTLSKAVCIYSGNLLKGVDIYHRHPVTKEWMLLIQASCWYNTAGQLAGINYQKVHTEDGSIAEVAECHLYWGTGLVSNVTTASAIEAPFELQLPNPYQTGDWVRVIGDFGQEPLFYRLYDIQGALLSSGRVPASGEWQLDFVGKHGLGVLVIETEKETLNVKKVFFQML